MAIDKGTQTVTLKVQERTRRIDILTPHGEVPRVVFRREIVKLNTDGSLHSSGELPPIELTAVQLAAMDFGGTKGAQLHVLLALAGDIISIAQQNGTGPFAAQKG